MLYKVALEYAITHIRSQNDQGFKDMSTMYELFRKNMAYLMEREGITSVTELARRIKMQQSTLQRMLSGEVKDPKYMTIKQIADFFRVSPIDLNECDLQEEKPRTVVDVDGDPYNFEFKEVPVLGNTQLGNGGFWTDMQYPVGSGDGHIRWPSYDSDVYALKCVGDSMVPRIKEGEFVIIEPNHDYHPGDEVLVITETGSNGKNFLV